MIFLRKLSDFLDFATEKTFCDVFEDTKRAKELFSDFKKNNNVSEFITRLSDVDISLLEEYLIDNDRVIIKDSGYYESINEHLKEALDHIELLIFNKQGKTQREKDNIGFYADSIKENLEQIKTLFFI